MGITYSGYTYIDTSLFDCFVVLLTPITVYCNLSFITSSATDQLSAGLIYLTPPHSLITRNPRRSINCFMLPHAFLFGKLGENTSLLTSPLSLSYYAWNGIILEISSLLVHCIKISISSNLARPIVGSHL